MNEVYDIHWNGNIVGSYCVESFDMWYNEGKFIPHSSAAAVEFFKTVSALNVGNVFTDFKNGIPTVLRPQSNPENEWHTIIMGFVGDMLHLRGVSYITKG
jgi:hypothetical protein